MEGVAEEFEAKAEAIVFLDHFRELPDPRQRGKVLYPLDEILLLCLLAVLAGGNINACWDPTEWSNQCRGKAIAMIMRWWKPCSRRSNQNSSGATAGNHASRPNAR